MVNVGLVGAGRRGKAHLDAIKNIPDVYIKAICDIDETTAKSVAKIYQAKPYTNYEEMLDKEELDAIFICTPTNVHVPQAILAAKHGVSFLLEKPVSLNIQEAKDLLKAVHDYKVVAGVGYQSRYLSIIDKALEIVEENKISMVNAHYYWTIPIIPWIRKRELGGGQIVDQSTHLIDLFRYVAGEIESVYASYSSVARSTEEDKKAGFENWDSYALTVRFKHGGVGNLSGTYALFPGIKDASGIDFIARELLMRYIHASRLEIITRNEVVVYTETRNPTVEMDRDFIKAIQSKNDEKLKVTLDKTIRSHAVALAANESAITGKVIYIDEFLGDID